MKPAGEERREFQRLQLDPSLPAHFGPAAVTVLEVGVLGARIRHDSALDDGISDLRFHHGDEEIVLRCEVVRTRTAAEGSGPGMESGLRFLTAVGESGERLRQMLGEAVTAALDNRRAAPVEQLDQTVDGDMTVRGVDAAYLCYRLESGVWSRRRVFLPEQPVSGFTVARSEDSEEMQRLCRIYQASDAEGRRLIRMFAELSVSGVLQLPPPG